MNTNHKHTFPNTHTHRLDMSKRLTKEFAEVEAEDFLADLHRHCHDLKSLSMGEDWKFGKDRQGSIATLNAFGKEQGVDIFAADAVMLDGERVSSTRVRQAVRDGNLEATAAMLGRPYTVLGTVIEGQKLGRSLL